jgi:hypothetical protein
MKPVTVTFMYNHYLIQSRYSRWLEELQRGFPFWTEIKLSISEKEICTHRRYPTKSDIVTLVSHLGDLGKHGTLYVAPQTFFIDPIKSENFQHFIDAYNDTSGEGYYYVPQMHPKTLNDMPQPVQKSACPKVQHTRAKPQSDSACVTIASYIQAKDIVYENAFVASKIRYILYGSHSLQHPRKDNSSTAPNIGHYVWFGGGFMNLAFYMSALSALYIAQLDQLFIHGDRPPSGLYWNLLQSRHGEKVRTVGRAKPPGIFNQTINVMGHIADIVKSDIMLRHGGIMLDPDIIFVKPIERDLYYYEAVLAKEPDRGLNMGISISKPHSEFAKRWLESERKFIDSDWLWNCGTVTYKIWQKFPQIALIHPHLQTFCHQDVCFGKHRINEPVLNIFNRSIAYHFTSPEPYPNSVYYVCYKQTGLTGQLGRLVLRAAGELKEYEGLVP